MPAETLALFVCAFTRSLIRLLLALPSCLGRIGLGSPLELFGRHILLVGGNCPLVAERVGELAEAVAPELFSKGMSMRAPTATALLNTESASSTYRNSDMPRLCGIELAWLKSSHKKSIESPIFSSA